MNTFSKLKCSAPAWLLAVALAVFFVPVGAAPAPAEDETENTSIMIMPDDSVLEGESSSEESSSFVENETFSDFYVNTVLPENQIDTGRKITYFNLMVRPEAEQRLEVEIVNIGSEDIFVDVAATTAATNRNGIIDYKNPGERDESLAVAFADIAEVVETPVMVPANGSASAYIDITLPEEEFDGAVLGGLVFTKQAPELSVDSSQGTVIQNVFNYVTSVVLRESDNEVQPDFELVEITPALIANQPSIVHEIRNPVAFIANGLEIDVEIYQGDDLEMAPVINDHRENRSMAPNTTMNMAVVPESGQLSPGDYTSVVTLRLAEDEWVFEKQFTIERNEANLVNEAVPGATTGPNWTVILLVVIGVLLLALVVVLVLLGRKRKKQP